jgi:organic radical activating enzyme
MMYPISEIFHSIQGEGHFSGYPMTFIRFSGCGVTSCAIRERCDERPWPVKWRLRACDVVDTAQSKSPSRTAGIVCLTGGEPTDHDLLPIVTQLRDIGYRVHIETSGGRSIEGIPFDWITVSPKTPDYRQRQGHTLKIVVLPEWGNVVDSWGVVAGLDGDSSFFHRYLQPLSGPDGQPVNLPHVVEMLTGGYRNSGARWALSTQAHKVWGVK